MTNEYNNLVGKTVKNKQSTKKYKVKKVRQNSGTVELSDGSMVPKEEFGLNWMIVE